VSGRLLDPVRALLIRARREMPDPSAQEILSGAVERLDEPLRLAIVGTVKAGKSTLLNAMVGEEIAPTDAGECTKIVTWYRNGPSYRVLLHLSDGRDEQRPFDRESGAIRVDLGHPAQEIEHLRVEVPSRRLRAHTLIDTPGLASLSTEVSLRTQSFLEADVEQAAPADAVIYLLRHLHGSDLRFLESFHGEGMVHGSPINAIGVLSRADEIGSCRMDAMAAARRVADRYHADERLRRLCPVVIPVAGLLAAAGATLREQEFRTLATLAAAPTREVIELLLTADRFSDAVSAIPVDVRARRQALTRLGLFGVRMGVRLIRDGAVRTATELAAELTTLSGLDRLNAVLDAQFGRRSTVLKANSALAALDALLRVRGRDGAGSLAAEAEQIRASAHEFVEVRLLHQLHSGRLSGRPDRLAEMERLLGGSGAEPARRLGLPTDAPRARLVAAGEQALARWQRIAEHPASARDLRMAARATVRSCEGTLAELGPRPDDEGG
jgi:hypothetical protein